MQIPTKPGLLAEIFVQQYTLCTLLSVCTLNRLLLHCTNIVAVILTDCYMYSYCTLFTLYCSATDGKRVGCGFVQYSSVFDASRAVKQMNGQEIQGTVINEVCYLIRAKF